MTLEAKLEDILEKIGEGTNFPNERSISQGIVLPILRELNWDTDDTSLVWPEYTVGGGLADFALCGKSDNPKVFIEVKKLGGVEKAEKKAEDQVMRYAHNKGVRIVVLTDGRTWSLYLPEKGGMGYDGKRVFKLNISDRPLQESSEVLQRYLEESRVVSDKALETARVIFFLRKHRNNNPGMWEESFKRAVGLVRALHHLVPVALAEELGPKVAQGNIDPDIVDYFHSLLREEISQSSSNTTAQPPKLEPGGQVSSTPTPGASERKQSVHRRVRQVSTPPEQKARRGSNIRIKNLVILGRRYHCRNQSHAMAIVFKQLQKADDGFLQRFYEHPENQRKGGRRYLGRNLQELFGNNVDGKSSESVGKGWVISTNYGWEVAGSKSSKKEIIQLAADVAGLKLKFKEDISGKGIIVNLDR